MWEPALSSPMSWNSMSCTTVPESQSSPESPECGRSAAEATSQTLKKSSAWIQNDYIYNLLVDAYNIRKEKNETVTIKASDGINLVGHYYERDKNAPLSDVFIVTQR